MTWFWFVESGIGCSFLYGQKRTKEPFKRRFETCLSRVASNSKSPPAKGKYPFGNPQNTKFYKIWDLSRRAGTCSRRLRRNLQSNLYLLLRWNCSFFREGRPLPYGWKFENLSCRDRRPRLSVFNEICNKISICCWDEIVRCNGRFVNRPYK